MPTRTCILPGCTTPLASGGAHSRANAQTACLSCNSRKQSAVPQVA